MEIHVSALRPIMGLLFLFLFKVRFFVHNDRRRGPMLSVKLWDVCAHGDNTSVKPIVLLNRLRLEGRGWEYIEVPIVNVAFR